MWNSLWMYSTSKSIFRWLEWGRMKWDNTKLPMTNSVEATR